MHSIFNSEWPVTQMYESAMKYIQQLDSITKKCMNQFIVVLTCQLQFCKNPITPSFSFLVKNDGDSNTNTEPVSFSSEPVSGDINEMFLQAQRLANTIRTMLVR